MKYLKFSYMIAFAVIAGLFTTACGDSDFEAGPAASGAQVYFPQDATTAYSVDDTVSSISIPVNRVASEEAASYDISLNDASGLFTAPTSVAFKAGESSANYVVTFSSAALEEGEEYSLAFTLVDTDNTTPYGNPTLTVSVSLWPWKLLGEGTFRDDFISKTAFNIGNPEVKVNIYEKKSKAGVYMIENAFENVITEGFGGTLAEVEAEGYVKYVATNLVIDASDPDAVTIERQFSGVTDCDSQYGDYDIVAIKDGTMVNGVIKFPVKGLALYMNTGGYYANLDGLFRVVLPGCADTDYSMTAEYTGMRVNATNTEASAIIDFGYGADVEGIKYAFYTGDVSLQVETLAAAIADGTATDVYTVSDFVKGGASVSVSAALDDSGLYTVVAVPLDANDKVVADNAVAASFFFAGLGGGEAPECDATLTLMSVTDLNPNYVAKYPDATSCAFVMTGTNIKAAKTLFASSAMISKYGASVALVEENGTALDSDDLGDWAEYEGYANIYPDLVTGTEYEMLAYVTNSYGKSVLLDKKYTPTAAESGSSVSFKSLSSVNNGGFMKAALKNAKRTVCKPIAVETSSCAPLEKKIVRCVLGNADVIR